MSWHTAKQMNRVLRSLWRLIGVTLGLVVVLGLSAAPSRAGLHHADVRNHETVARFSITDLNSAGDGMWPTAINDRGQVVGNLTRTDHAFLYFGRVVTDIGVPVGYERSAALGVSDNERILVHAYRTNRYRGAYFVVSMQARAAHWALLRTGIRGYGVASASEVDARGDVIGSIHHGSIHGSPSGDDAALWLGIRGGYGRAEVLPLPGNAIGASAHAIWAGGGFVIVAGCTYGERGSSQRPCTTLWAKVPGHPFQISSANVTGSLDTFGGIGGHAFASGSDGDGYDQAWGWTAPVEFSRQGAAQVSEPVSVSPPPNGHSTVWSVTGVTADRLGRMVAVGDNGARGDSASIWLPGERSELLQSLIGAGSGWSIGRPAAISIRGQIVGIGTFDGRGHAYLLTPIAGRLP